MADDAASDRLVAGRYRLGTLIGRGGAGAVWRGHDERLDRPVAVKEITFAAGADAAHAGHARALREARAAARLGGAGVVQIYDILEADDRAFLLMVLVDAPNLQGLVQRDGPLSPATAAALGLGLLDTLEAAHQVGIVHRDVKPSNVLIDGELPRLTDFWHGAAERRHDDHDDRRGARHTRVHGAGARAGEAVGPLPMSTASE